MDGLVSQFPRQIGESCLIPAFPMIEWFARAITGAGVRDRVSCRDGPVAAESHHLLNCQMHECSFGKSTQDWLRTRILAWLIH